MSYLLDRDKLEFEAEAAGFYLNEPGELQRLADESGLSRDTVDNVARGRVRDPRGSTLIMLSQALQCEPHALYSDIKPF